VEEKEEIDLERPKASIKPPVSTVIIGVLIILVALNIVGSPEKHATKTTAGIALGLTVVGLLWIVIDMGRVRRRLAKMPFTMRARSAFGCLGFALAMALVALWIMRIGDVSAEVRYSVAAAVLAGPLLLLALAAKLLGRRYIALPEASHVEVGEGGILYITSKGTEKAAWEEIKALGYTAPKGAHPGAIALVAGKKGVIIKGAMPGFDSIAEAIREGCREHGLEWAAKQFPDETKENMQEEEE